MQLPQRGAALFVALFLAISPLTAYAEPPADKTLQAAEIAQVNGDVWAEADDDDLFDDEEFEDEAPVSDPFEPFNRVMFKVNDKLYFYVAKPVARGLRVVPEPARISVRNFFSNLTTPIRFASSLLQLKFRDAGTELSRLVINTTVGIGGLFDPARTHFGLEKKDEDIGQVLGRYGIGGGPYLVLPVFGPMNVRDGVGKIGDILLNPITYVEEDKVRYGAIVLDKENEIALDDDTYEGIKQDALDPYLFIRSAYTQNRAGKIKK